MEARTSDERRTVAELVVRYELEPQLTDIYVEGPSDAALISWFLKRHSRRWRVYSIQTVDVPTNLVRELGLDDGERGRILALSTVLERELRDVVGIRPLFIADRDLDYVLGSTRPVSTLCLLTDFTSMELYGYDEGVLEKLLAVFLRVRGITAREVMEALRPALVELFLIRAALYQGQTGIGIIDGFTNCCTHRAGVVALDTKELVRRSINASRVSTRPMAETVLVVANQLKRKLPPDTRLAIHGHDFTRLLAWLLSSHVSGQQFRQEEVIRRALFICLEVADLEKYPLFIDLLHRTES